MEACFVKIKSIDLDGEEDVYCLDNPQTGNFVVNEGIVIKNCQDALRYVLYTRFQHGVYPIKREPKPAPKAWDPMGEFFDNRSMQRW